MKKRAILFLLLAAFGMPIFAQDLTVPPEIIAELHSVTLPCKAFEVDSIQFKVVYPKYYDENKAYPVALCLSGGNQSVPIVDYCYAAWFRSKYFNKHLTILPISPKGKNLRDASVSDIKSILLTISSAFKTSKKDWLIAGTSNGGVATFNFVSTKPKCFKHVIVMPGAIGKDAQLRKSWRHLRIVLAYGEQDAPNWIENTEKTKQRLLDVTPYVQTVVMKGQGHILPIGYEIDVVYEACFSKE